LAHWDWSNDIMRPSSLRRSRGGGPASTPAPGRPRRLDAAGQRRQPVAAESRDWPHLLSGLAQFLTAIATIGALIFTARSLAYTADAARATRDELALRSQEQIADRFSRAIDQLGQEDVPGQRKVSIRLGGVYALEDLMHDSPDDEATIIEVLCAFVRTHAAAPTRETTEAIPASAADVQAAVSVLARRPNPNAERNRRIDLTGSRISMIGAPLAGAHLAGADLVGAELSGADLSGADLAGANLVDAALSRANLAGADLTGALLTGAAIEEANVVDARLVGADLTGSTLLHATLSHADLSRADLSNASLVIASLTGAKLTGTDLTGAFLAGANLAGADLTVTNLTGTTLAGTELAGADLADSRNLTSDQVRCASVNDMTKLPAGIVRPNQNAGNCPDITQYVLNDPRRK
jgi:hypothetical protein